MALAEDGLLALYEEYTALESTLDALKITHQYTSNSLIESANAVSQQSWTKMCIRDSPWTTDRQICPPDKLHHDQRKK